MAPPPPPPPIPAFVYALCSPPPPPAIDVHRDVETGLHGCHGRLDGGVLAPARVVPRSPDSASPPAHCNSKLGRPSDWASCPALSHDRHPSCTRRRRRWSFVASSSPADRLPVSTGSFPTSPSSALPSALSHHRFLLHLCTLGSSSSHRFLSPLLIVVFVKSQ